MANRIFCVSIILLAYSSFKNHIQMAFNLDASHLYQKCLENQNLNCK